jgi:predicted nuclease of predicted toxin-antitoxin system
MGMPVKLDEPLSQLAAEPLLRQGYLIRTVRGQGWGGLKDPELWPNVLKEGIFFITTDKGFGDVRLFSPGTHPGILLLRPDKESILEFRVLLEAVMQKHSLEDLRGCLTVASPRGIRIRRK